jgi:hypothetical protein
MALAFAEVPAELSGSEIAEKFNLESPRFSQDFSYWVDQIDKSEDAAKTLVVYSDAPISTSLLRPRRIASPNGRLFVAKTIKKDGTQEFEFISWNSTYKKNDFGMIKNFGQPDAQIQMANRSQCLECHKTSSAIFMKGPWVNTTGANSPSAALLSFGILNKNIFLKSPYGDYPPNTISPFQFKIDHIPVFDFKGAEPLDENVVKNYLLTLTFEIQRRLDETLRKKFAADITTSAMRAFLLPKEIEFSWNWLPFLKSYQQKELQGQVLLSGVGPLRSNYFPSFENAEIARHITEPLSSYSPRAFENLLLADKEIEKSEVDIFPTEASPRNIKVFEPLVTRFRSDTATETLKTLFQFSALELRTVKKLFEEDRDTIHSLFLTEAWQNLFLTGEIPTAKEIIKSLKQVTGPYRIRVENMQPHRCFNCHDSNGSAPKMPLDALKPELWEEKLKSNISNFERQELLRWVKKIPERIRKPKGDSLRMPPDNANETAGTEDLLNIAEKFERIRSPR